MGSSPIKYPSRVTPSVGQNDQSLRHSFLRHLHAEHLHFGLPHPRLHYRPVPAECAFCATLANCRDENDDGTDHSLFKLSPTLPHVCVPSPTARATSWQPSGGGIADQLIGTMAGAAHRRLGWRCRRWCDRRRDPHPPRWRHQERNVEVVEAGEARTCAKVRE
jgi:hypothetical protein